MAPTLRTALFVVLVALLVRGAIVPAVISHPDRLFLRDSYSYVRPAVNLLAGHGYSQHETAPYIPDTGRTPVYPLFIAALYGLFGQQPLLVAGVQVVISAITCGLTYILGVLLLSKLEGRLGGLLLAFSLGSIVYSFYILTETLFTLLLLSVACTLAVHWQNGRGRWLVAAGLLMGLAVLCRPIALFYPLAVAALVGFAGRRGTHGLRRGPWLQRLTGSLLFLGAAHLLVVPWVVRGYRLLGLLTVSTLTSYNLFFYGAGSLEAHLRGVGENEMRAEMVDRVQAELARQGAYDEAAKARLYTDWSRTIIMAHPWHYLYVHLKSDLNSLLPNATEFLELLGVTRGDKGTLSVLNQYGLRTAVRHYFGEQAWLLWLLSPSLVLLGLSYMGMLAGGVVLALRRAWFQLALLLLPIVYYLLVPGALSHPRFRVPVMPYVSLLAGIGLTTTWRQLQQRLSFRVHPKSVGWSC